MQTERTRAVLLRSIAYGDHDRVVTLLTATHGKLGAMARGAQRSTKRFGGALEPYAILDVELALGRGELARLASADIVRVFPGILADLARMSVAAAGLEVVRLALADREPPDPRLFETLERFFELAERGSGDALRLAFAARCLALVGLAPGLARCASCGREAKEGKAALFDPALGALVCRACGGGPLRLGGGARAVLQHGGGGGWAEVAERPLKECDRREASAALDAFVERHLGRRLAVSDVVTQVREVSRIAGRAEET